MNPHELFARRHRDSRKPRFARFGGRFLVGCRLTTPVLGP